MAQVPSAPQVLDPVPVLSQGIFSRLSSPLWWCHPADSPSGMQIDLSEAALSECFILNESWQAAHVL